MEKIKNQEIRNLAKVTVRTGTLTEILGVSRMQIFRLARQGFLKKVGPGEFLLLDSIQGYIRYLRGFCFHLLPFKGAKK